MNFKFFYFLLFICQLGFSQNLSGIIVSSESKGMERVKLLNLRTKATSFSDKNGFFSFVDSSINDSIVATKSGYKELIFVVKQFDSNRLVMVQNPYVLDQVIVSSGYMPLTTVSEIDLKINPVSSSQEFLRKVPGLFIGQHAGGGKAEQLFLRGFDIDHGTDVAIDVDGSPVNMVSHAHGQGYADLHFVIPETIQKIDFDKGSYVAKKGNFATAGYVSLQTKEVLESNVIAVELGQFNTQRTLGMFNLIESDAQKAYIATDYQKTNGPFDSPQHFDRLNIFAKYTHEFKNNSHVALSIAHFKSQWDASGQIPERAVASGLIGRFGAIDDTEGGTTSRTNLVLKYQKSLSESLDFKTTFFYSKYDFELYSNFTFFLNDPINGDQIRQKENRSIMGFESQLNQHFVVNSAKINLQGAVGLRNDLVDNNELSNTLNRSTTITQIQLGDIHETNTYGFLTAEISSGKWKINPALRLDYFRFEYQNKLVLPYQTKSGSQAKWSPKLNFSYQQNDQLNWYLKLGKGFHSNDTRVVLEQNSKDKLPNSYGADIGVTWKPYSRILFNSAFWLLNLEQEFVYVGDAGIVEPSGKSKRKGFDLGLRYQLQDQLFFNADFTKTIAKSSEEPKGADYIPLAPKTTFVAGLSWIQKQGFSGAISSRYLGDRPANEDYSIVAKGYFITDINLSYSFSSGIETGCIVQNVFNTAWNETQFATESRLRTEPESVTEIHFTPGTPFNGRLFLRYKF